MDQHINLSYKYPQSLLDEVSIGLALCDMNGKIVNINIAYANIIGRSIEETINLTYWEITPKKYNSQEEEQLKKLDETGRYGPYEKEYLHKDGHLVPVRLQGVMLKLEDVEYIWSSVEDLTETKKYHNKLLSSERRYRDLFEHAVDGIILTNKYGIITSFNQSAQEIFGYDKHEVLGKNIKILTPPAIQKHHEQYVQNYHETGVSEIIGAGRYVKALHKTGKEVHIDIKITMYEHETDVAFMSVVHDVSSKKRAELLLKDSEQKFRILSEGSFEGIVIHNDGIILNVNEQFLKIFGYSIEEIIGQNVMKTLLTPESLIKAQENITNKTTKPYELCCIKKNGDTFPVEICAKNKVMDGRKLRVTAFRDISEIRKQQSKLSQAKQEAENANVAKSEFLSSMSHELRTPLNAILGFSQLLKIDSDQFSKDQNSSIDEILNGGNHLLNLINEVLDFAKIESGKFSVNMENVCLQLIIEECLSTISPLAIEKAIAIDLESMGDYFVLADEFRLKQVILNYFSNAIKYNKKNGYVKVACTVINENRLRVTVTDSGKGLTESQQEKLFIPFERIDAENSLVEGTGIGLVISKRLVELMGGTVGVESKTGVGSSFWFELSISDHNSTKKKATKNSVVHEDGIDKINSKTTPKSILYIDDNHANIRLLSRTFEMIPDNYQFFSSDSAENGLKMANSIIPDLILLDIKMPVMDGFEVYQQLQNNSATKDIPVIAVSANAMKKDVAQSYAAGFKAYITKPIDIEELLREIKKFVK